MRNPRDPLGSWGFLVSTSSTSKCWLRCRSSEGPTRSDLRKRSSRVGWGRKGAARGGIQVSVCGSHVAGFELFSSAETAGDIRADPHAPRGRREPTGGSRASTVGKPTGCCRTPDRSNTVSLPRVNPRRGRTLPGHQPAKGCRPLRPAGLVTVVSGPTIGVGASGTAKCSPSRRFRQPVVSSDASPSWPPPRVSVPVTTKSFPT